MKNSILISAILLLCVASCKKDNNKGFDDKLVIEPMEAIAFKDFALNCETEKVYNGTMTISSSMSKNGNNIVINFNGVPFSSDFPVPGPARGSAGLGVLANGNYTVTINNGKKQSNGTLAVTDESYTLAFDKLNDISFKHTKLYRIPAYTIWGMVKCRVVTPATLANSFTDSLGYLGAQPFTGAEGYYGYFDISNGSVTINNNRWANYPYVKCFVYKYTGNKSNVDTLVRSFGQRNIDSAYFKVNTSEGNIYEFPMAVYAL